MEHKAIRQRMVIVLGMHRSGTSAIARGLKALGIDLGDRLLPAVENDNDKGYWEDSDINSLNAEMMADIGLDWHSLTPVGVRDIETLFAKGYQERALQLLERKIGQQAVFGLKDPRIAKLLPFWKKVFGQCEFDVCYVLALRNPISVSESLARRVQFPPEKSFYLWLEHVLWSLRYTRDKARVMVDYDRLLESPERELNRISTRLGFKLSSNEQRFYEREFLADDMRHCIADFDTLSNCENAPALIKEVYGTLVKVAFDELDVDGDVIATQVKGWAGELDRLRPLLAFADRLDQKCQERDAEVTALNLQVSERDKAIVDLRRVAGEATSRAETLLQVTRDLERGNDATRSQLEILKGQLTDRDMEVMRLNCTLGEREMQAAALRSELEQMRVSNSWRITAPIRFVGGLARALKRVPEVVRHSKRLDGSSSVLAKKIVLVLRGEGLRGVVRRLVLRWNMVRSAYPESACPLVTFAPADERNRDRYEKRPDLDAHSINYYGYIRATSGLGTACRNYIGALRHGLLDVTSINIPCGLDEVDFEVQSAPNRGAMFSIVHMNADSVGYFFNRVDEAVLRDTYNIGLWVWELAAFRPDWFASFDAFHEIWVPSEFCRRSVAAIAPVPVFVVPHAVTLRPIAEGSSRQRFQLPTDAFVFGYMFDCSSSIARKNPFALIDAFTAAFDASERVVLVLKLSNGAKDRNLYNEVLNQVKRSPNIRIYEEPLSDDDLRRFFDSLDCYVSPHRAEGFGLTIAEAMLAGKPVIATNYGGTTDFVKPEVAYPVSYNLCRIEEQHGPYLPEYLWAEPDRDHLIQRMREVFEDPAAARTRGEAAQRFVESEYSVDQVSKIMSERLRSIGEKYK